MAFGIAGGVVGLAGPPGVGKSTLLATFATLRRPSSGALEILGYDTGSTPDLRAARARIGYLPGCFSWAENMTAGEFVAYAAYYKRVQASAARSVLKRLDLADAAATELALLPPDARLRAGLAAACVHEPDLVLLDDPFAGLTAASAAELVPVVRALAPSVVLTSGDTPPLMGWCDRLFTLARGKLTELPPGAPVHAPRAPRPFREGPGKRAPRPGARGPATGRATAPRPGRGPASLSSTDAYRRGRPRPARPRRCPASLRAPSGRARPRGPRTRGGRPRAGPAGAGPRRAPPGSWPPEPR
ncbi:ATP-binding cassette domain-containing protein [Actinomadura yumaensis]|uniref:ATP-binding cassette domain-containing protein n=1 Tax=Actinomadura yumaensis TaxID=111807 RepID=UPI003607CFE4